MPKDVQSHRLRRYLQRKQQDIQDRLQESRSQYEQSGKSRFLLIQSQWQGTLTAYQDILRMYGIYLAYDETDAMLPALQAHCLKKRREAEQHSSRCQAQHSSTHEEKYRFLQRQYAGEAAAYQTILQYIQALHDPSIFHAPPHENSVPSAETPDSTAPVAGPHHVLVMEGSALIRKSIEMILRSEGFTVTSASDAVIGLDMAQKISPDVILMDSDIARRNEEQLAFMLHRQRKLRKIPIIVLEGAGRPVDFRMSSHAGILTGLKKPFQPDELVRVILDTLAR